MIPDLLADPFGERSHTIARRRLHLLGGRVVFESANPELLRLVDAAYADLPRHRLSARTPELRVGLVLTSSSSRRGHRRAEPPPLQMLSAIGFAGGATPSSSFVVVSPRAGTAIVSVPGSMLRFPYHTRYELIEFAVFTLAARSQGLVSLHAACVGRAGRGILLMGPTGSGKSTLTLQCMLQGFEILSEDSVFVAPGRMLATGVPNFLHVQAESLRWLRGTQDAAAIRNSPVIRRRSGIATNPLPARACTAEDCRRRLSLAATGRAPSASPTSVEVRAAAPDGDSSGVCRKSTGVGALQPARVAASRLRIAARAASPRSRPAPALAARVSG
jgi:hypothetical protein